MLKLKSSYLCVQCELIFSSTSEELPYCHLCTNKGTLHLAKLLSEDRETSLFKPLEEVLKVLSRLGKKDEAEGLVRKLLECDSFTKAGELIGVYKETLNTENWENQCKVCRRTYEHGDICPTCKDEE